MIGEYFGSKEFDESTNWENLFRNWLGWLKDRKRKVQDKSFRRDFK